MRMIVRDTARTIPEKEVQFWLEQDEGGVSVRASLIGAVHWNILKFYNDGTVKRFTGVGTELDLPLDITGKVIIN